MLKLDLTGQSSHVSFSKNILSSSSRALGWGEQGDSERGETEGGGAGVVWKQGVDSRSRVG